MPSFNISNSKLAEDGAQYITGVNLLEPIENAIGQGIGIGEAAVRALKESGIETFVQLVGQFLIFKTSDSTMQEHCENFYNFLATLRDPKTGNIAITGHRAGLVDAIGRRADKLAPGIYDPYEL